MVVRFKLENINSLKTHSSQNMVVQKLLNLNFIVAINETQIMIKQFNYFVLHQLDVMIDSTAICSQRRTLHFDAQLNLRFCLYIKPSNRINLVMLNPQSKLRETLSIFAKYKTIQSLRSTMRQVNDAHSLYQRNSSCKTKTMNKKLWSHGAWVSGHRYPQ